MHEAHDHCGENTLLISEIFHSLQGEGPWIGTPCALIRLAGCIEPFCPFCDTPYSLWEGRDMTVRDILGSVEPFRTGKAVITGGEPFLQWDRGLSELHEALLSLGYEIQYETSGKVKIPDVGRSMVVCSPKLHEGAWLIETENIDAIDYFKFIAVNEEWLRAVDDFVTANMIERERVFIMPLGSTRKEQLQNMAGVFDFCLDRGYRMTPRLHVLIHDSRRGV